MLTRLLDALVIAVVKKFHGKRPAYEKIAYGWPSEGTCATLPKSMVKTIMLTRG